MDPRKKSSHPDMHTVLNGVTGHPLGHTLSPGLHARIYEMLGINAVMLAFPHEDIGAVIASMRALPIHLLAVTLPHKQEVMKHLDHIDPVAREIGAVNTVVNRGGKLYGHNTDIIGIAEALKDVPVKNKNVLVLGAGGAARPLCWFFKKNNAHIFCLNRTRTKAEELMKVFGGTALDNEALAETRIDVIMNATPVGMEPHPDESPFNAHLLNSGQTVFDLIYNPSETRLLKDAKKAGAKTVNGMPMLVAQALEQVRLWSGKELTESQKHLLLKTMETA
jgi:shikimate dehydrogenase